jgi:DNA polymerase III alpha subunit
MNNIQEIETYGFSRNHMKKDILLKGKVIFDSQKICSLLLRKKKLTDLHMFDNVEKEKFVRTCENLGIDINMNFIEEIVHDYTDEEIESRRNTLLIPEKYKSLTLEDMKRILLKKVKTKEEISRVEKEFEMAKRCNMENFLKILFYLSDVIKENKLVIGVGRGSSVSLYILYLLGLHKVDSILYDLNPNEFFKLEE